MPYYPPASTGAAVTVKEVDGTPSVTPVTEIKVSNGTLTDNTGGSVSIATGASGAGTITTVKDEGSTLSSAVTDIDFVGAGVTATGTTSVTVTIPGGGGALVLLEQHTASASATLDFTTFLSSTYDEYLFEFLNVRPATDLQSLILRCDTGSGFDTGSNYSWAGVRASAAGSAVTGSTSTTGIGLDVNGTVKNTAALGGFTGSLRLFAPLSTTVDKRVAGQFGYPSSGADVNITAHVAGMYMVSGSALVGVRFLFSAGNVADGTIRVYGIAKT